MSWTTLATDSIISVGIINLMVSFVRSFVHLFVFCPLSTRSTNTNAKKIDFKRDESSPNKYMKKRMLLNYYMIENEREKAINMAYNLKRLIKQCVVGVWDEPKGKHNAHHHLFIHSSKNLIIWNRFVHQRRRRMRPTMKQNKKKLGMEWFLSMLAIERAMTDEHFYW